MEPESQETKDAKQSRLLTSLREGIAVVQMIFFKELRGVLAQNYPTKDATQLSMLTGAIVNEVFGTPNTEERFVTFRKEYWGTIEQELLGLKDHLPHLLSALTDALRIQTLCDSQEGSDSSSALLHSKKYHYLEEEREIPLPSAFMMLIRTLGEQHNLIIPPAQITPEQDQTIVH